MAFEAIQLHHKVGLVLVYKTGRMPLRLQRPCSRSRARRVAHSGLALLGRGSETKPENGCLAVLPSAVSGSTSRVPFLESTCAAQQE
jgi:hypothetical protein